MKSFCTSIDIELRKTGPSSDCPWCSPNEEPNPVQLLDTEAELRYEALRRLTPGWKVRGTV